MFISTKNIVDEALGCEATSASVSSDVSELTAARGRALADIEASAARIKGKTTAELAGLRSRLHRLCRWAELVVVDGVPGFDLQPLIDALRERELRETEAKNRLHEQLNKYKKSAKEYPPSIWQITMGLFKCVDGNAEAVVQEFQRARLTLKKLAETVPHAGSGTVVSALDHYNDAFRHILEVAHIGKVDVDECDGQPFYTVSIRVPDALLAERKKLRNALQAAHEMVGRKMPKAVGMFAFRWEATGRES